MTTSIFLDTCKPTYEYVYIEAQHETPCRRPRAKLNDPRDAWPMGSRFDFHRIITGRGEKFTLKPYACYFQTELPHATRCSLEAAMLTSEAPTKTQQPPARPELGMAT